MKNRREQVSFDVRLKLTEDTVFAQFLWQFILQQQRTKRLSLQIYLFGFPQQPTTIFLKAAPWDDINFRF